MRRYTEGRSKNEDGIVVTECRREMRDEFTWKEMKKSLNKSGER